MGGPRRERVPGIDLPDPGLPPYSREPYTPRLRSKRSLTLGCARAKPALPVGGGALPG